MPIHHCNAYNCYELCAPQAVTTHKPEVDRSIAVHQIIIRFNGWQGCKVDVPFIQLTLLSEHTDAKQVTLVGD